MKFFKPRVDPASGASPGDGPLVRIRRYTTLSLLVLVLVFSMVTAMESTTIATQVGAVVGGLVVAWFVTYWYKRPPLWLTIAALTISVAVWTLCVVLEEIPFAALLPAITVTLHVPMLRPRWAIVLGGIAIMCLPVLIVALVHPSGGWLAYLLSGLLSYASALLFAVLNAYAWRLSLDIDNARKVSAELAVAQERFRFAADLHDIQGHTLHVIRLKTQLARKLIDRDPEAARAQLVEADELIGETLANTRSLAFGDRHVGLASELANARELFVAAGIEWTVTGTSQPGPHDELFGLVVRESTTNILRHAQATRVSVDLTPGRIVIVNDGSPTTKRPASGLARLGERFEAAGGALESSLTADRFSTEARLP